MAVGIIVEYNPFHNGHLHHLLESKKHSGQQYAVAVMSGNFVQRGMPACLDKYKRTEMALKNGVDIVLELPCIYATASAEYFARGAIDILNATGIVKQISFGAENPDIDYLYKIATIFTRETDIFKQTIKNSLNQGVSYPKAREIALTKVLPDINVKFSPNNILGIEYIKALIRTNSAIKPIAIKRLGDHHSTKLQGLASASAIRAASGDVSPFMPTLAYDIFVNNIGSSLNNYSHIMQYILKTKNATQLKEILDIEEGLENAIISAASTNYYITDILDKIKTKRYTRTRLQRAIIHILLDIKKAHIEKFYKTVPYVRVLGFRKEAEHLLKEIKKNTELITNLKAAQPNDLLKKEIYATDMYYLGQGTNIARQVNIEYKKSLIII